MEEVFSLCAAKTVPAGGAAQWVHLLPSGKIAGRDGRRFTLHNATTIIAEFERRGGPIVIDYEHASARSRQTTPPQAVPAAGWITKLQARADGVWGLAEWTAKAREMIAAREYRFLSPEIAHSKNSVDVLAIISAGLVHNPNFRLTALNKQEDGRMADDPKMTDAERAFRASLIATLTLAEDVSDDDIIAAVDAALNAAPDPAKYVPIEAVKDLMKERHTAANALSKRDVEHRVSLALNEGSITPGMKEWATALCQSDPDSFEEFLTSTGAPYAHLFTSMDGTFAASSLNDVQAGPQSSDAASIAAQLGIDPKELN